MKRNISVLGAFAAMAVTLAFPLSQTSQAVLIEGFESNTLGPAVGDASIRTPDYFGINPTEGIHQLLLTTINNANDTPRVNQSGTNAAAVGAIGTFLGVSVPSIRNTLTGPPQPTGTEGSAALFNLGFIAAGGVISFDYNFLTTEINGVHDFAFITLTGLPGETSTFADTLSATSVTTGVGNPFNLESLYQQFSFNITTDGVYTLGIGVVDATNTGNPSALLIDNIQVVPIPEPSTIGLGVAGAVLLIALRRRAKKGVL